MEIICEELAKTNTLSGTSGRVDSAELQYLVCGTSDIAAGKKKVEEIAPLTYQGCSRDSISVDKHDSMYAIYYRVTYKTDGDSLQPTDDSIAYTFGTTGGTAKLTKPITRFDYWSLKKDADKWDGIGWNPNSKTYEGVDVTVPMMTESYQKTFTLTEFTTDYKRLINSMIGTVNNTPFKGWEAGEVLFSGINASGQIKRGNTKIPVTFNFMISPNLKNFKLADDLYVNKRGWTYVWYIWNRAPDETKKIIVPKLTHAFLDQIYRESNFGALRLGQ